MTASDHILITRTGPVQTLRFNRPEKRNAITSPMYAALATALESGERSDAISVHVILGQPGVFTAGNDISEFKAYAEGGALGEQTTGFIEGLARLRKPLIAGVDGLAVGIGTTLLLHCDHVIATPRATFRTPFIDLGLAPEAASSLLAPRLMGHQRAFALICMGETFDAERALAAGLVNRIVRPEEIEAHVQATALALAGKPQEALLAARRLLKDDSTAILARMDEENALFSERLRSAEAKEAFEAFTQKRPADFSKLRKG